MKKLEKIIIVTSGPLKSAKRSYDNIGNSYMDTCNTTGKLIFLGDKKKYERMKKWMKEIDQWKNMDEVYIFDRFHKNGEDMVKRATQKLHEFSYVITLKEEYKECWWNGEVSGCRLYPEFALDPKNERW